MSGMRDITLAHAATNAAASLLADIDWDGLLDDCHHAMALLADGNCPPGLDPVEAMATTRHNMAAINASRRYVREMRGIAEAPLLCTSDDPTNHQGDTCPIHEA